MSDSIVFNGTAQAKTSFRLKFEVKVIIFFLLFSTAVYSLSLPLSNFKYSAFQDSTPIKPELAKSSGSSEFEKVTQAPMLEAGSEQSTHAVAEKSPAMSAGADTSKAELLANVIKPQQPQNTARRSVTPVRSAGHMSNTQRRQEILQSCGDVCNTSIPGTPGHHFDVVRKRVDCMGLYANRESDRPSKRGPMQIPYVMKNDYAMNGQAKIKPTFRAKSYEADNGEKTKGAKQVVWSEELVERMMKYATSNSWPRDCEYGYGYPNLVRLSNFVKALRDTIRGRHLYVIGSILPWLETILLAHGAGEVTTIEYRKIISRHPRLHTMTNEDVVELFLKTQGKQPLFDGGATYSSLEHSGLGRYGDSLNPWGDLQAMAKTWCITKPGGVILVGWPSADQDAVVWNDHRVYGPKRWAQIMANWHQMPNAPIAGELWQSTGKYRVGRGDQPMVPFLRMNSSLSSN